MSPVTLGNLSSGANIYHHSTKQQRKISQVCCCLYCYACTAKVHSKWQQTSDIFSGIVWYYGNNDLIIRTFNFIAHSDAVRMTCSTWYKISCNILLIRILTWLVVPGTYELLVRSWVPGGTDMAPHMTCSKTWGFLWTEYSCKAFPLTPIHSCVLDVW